MATFSIEFQRSHDIDWFARIGHTYIHALSFGGLLPVEVNNRERNFVILRHAYRRTYNSQIKMVVNDAYIERRIRPQAKGNDAIDFERRKERYLRHFIDMAKRGFWSFDRDLYDEKKYHLIAKPREECIDEQWYGTRITELEPRGFENNGENDWVLLLK